jgi:hypothetical protein
VGFFGGVQGLVETAQTEMDLGQCVPGVERGGNGGGGAVEFGQGVVGIAQGEVKGRVFDERLEFGVCHGDTEAVGDTKGHKKATRLRS